MGYVSQMSLVYLRLCPTREVLRDCGNFTKTIYFDILDLDISTNRFYDILKFDFTKLNMELVNIPRRVNSN